MDRLPDEHGGLCKWVTFYKFVLRPSIAAPPPSYPLEHGACLAPPDSHSNSYSIPHEIAGECEYCLAQKESRAPTLPTRRPGGQTDGAEAGRRADRTDRVASRNNRYKTHRPTSPLYRNFSTYKFLLLPVWTSGGWEEGWGGGGGRDVVCFYSRLSRAQSRVPVSPSYTGSRGTQRHASPHNCAHFFVFRQVWGKSFFFFRASEELAC